MRRLARARGDMVGLGIERIGNRMGWESDGVGIGWLGIGWVYGYGNRTRKRNGKIKVNGK